MMTTAGTSSARSATYIGSLHIDSCTCEACGARWDEDIETGRYRGRGSLDSVIVPRQH